jgi:hypothetical protein
MEFLVMNDPMRRAGDAARRHGRARAAEAREHGMRTMYEDGLQGAGSA